MLFLLAFLLGASLSQTQAAQKPPTVEELFYQARQYFEKQEWEKAKQAAARILKADPRFADAEVMLGLIATVESQLSVAEKHFERAIALQPQNDQAQGYLASTYFQQKRYAEAARAYKKVLSRNPQNEAANYNLGLIALIQEKPALARSYFEQVLRKNPDDIPALIGTLECRLLLKQIPESRALTTKLQGMLTVQDTRLFQVATMLALYQQYDPAIAILERIRQAYPKSYDVNYNLALGYLRSGKYDRAVSILEPLLGQPRSAETYSLLAQAREQLRQPDQAVLAYQKAAELEPGNEDYRFDYAYALLQYATGDAGTTAFVSAVRDFPKSWRMQVGLGSAYYLAGRYEDAVLALLEAVKLEPAANAAYYLLGKAYEPARDRQPAVREAFKAYLAKEPRDPWAYYHYGTMLFLEAQAQLTQDFEPAKSNLNKALAMNPDFAEAHLQMGIIEQTEGRLAESVQSLEKAVRLNPTIPAPHYRLALVYQRLGNNEKSKEQFELFEKLKASGAAQEKQDVVQSLSGQKK